MKDLRLFIIDINFTSGTTLDSLLSSTPSIEEILLSIETHDNNYYDVTSSSSSSLIKLKLDNNKISGATPLNFINLNSLKVLHLSNNLLRGTFTLQLKILHTLDDMQIENNKTTCAMPYKSCN